MERKLFYGIILLLLAVNLSVIAQTEIPTSNFAFVSSGKYLVLSNKVEENWIKGTFKEDTTTFCLVADANFYNIPKEYQSLTGKKFLVYDQNCNTIEAKAVSIKIISLYVSHFGDAARWESMTKEEIFEERLSKGENKLVAELELDKNFYGLFSQQVGKQPFLTYTKFTDKKNDSLAMNLFKKLEYCKNIQKEFEDFKSKPENHEVNVKSWLEYYTAFYYVHFSNTPNDYCTSLRIYGAPQGGFDNSCIIVWRFLNTKPELFYQKADTWKYLEFVLDMDGDNIPELILSDMNGYYLINAKGETLKEYTYPNYDCPY